MGALLVLSSRHLRGRFRGNDGTGADSPLALGIRRPSARKARREAIRASPWWFIEGSELGLGNRALYSCLRLGAVSVKTLESCVFSENNFGGYPWYAGSMIVGWVSCIELVV